MDWWLTCKALLLGVVEGLTEFLPVSSTGHLIVTGSVLDFEGEFAKTFFVVIQFGAILAVCWEFRRKIGSVIAGLPTRSDARRFALNVLVATVPAVALGLLFERAIKSVLFAPVPVAFALVAGGLVILWVEGRRRSASTPAAQVSSRVRSIDDITAIDAFKVGCAQCFALIPGMSRSGSTIIGAMLFGFERRVATEFSFFLAIPVIFGATAYELHKNWQGLPVEWFGLFGLGFVAAFVSAFLCVRWLLRFVASNDFTAFAWYRIVFGLVILLFGYGGGLGWDD
jgi:undecaprenyl-diphosphatase